MPNRTHQDRKRSDWYEAMWRAADYRRQRPYGWRSDVAIHLEHAAYHRLCLADDKGLNSSTWGIG